MDRPRKEGFGELLLDENNIPIGIGMGPFSPDWVPQDRKIRVYAGISDINGDDGRALSLPFNKWVYHLPKSPYGEQRLDLKNTFYEAAVQKLVLDLKPGERTGYVIPSVEWVAGKYPSGLGLPGNNSMYHLKFESAFIRTVYRAFTVGATYICATEVEGNPNCVHGADVYSGNITVLPKDTGNGILRPLLFKDMS